LNNELPAFSTVAHPNSSLNFMPIPMSHWASRTARGSHVSRAAGEWACALHVAKCQASHGDRRRPRRLGWRISFMAIDGLPAIAQVKYLQGRSFWCGSSTCNCTASALRWIPRIHWIAVTQARAAVASQTTSAVVAGCRCLFLGSWVAACGIHATADEENRPMQS
jgi:hypothetical protein